MPSPLELRQRIRSVRNTRQITRAMQLVAASRMRRAQEAVEAARWHHSQRGTQSDTHLSSAPDGDRLTIEDRYPPSVLDGLRDKGHTLEVLPGWAEWGSAQAILLEPETGTMTRSGAFIKVNCAALPYVMLCILFVSVIWE